MNDEGSRMYLITSLSSSYQVGSVASTHPWVICLAHLHNGCEQCRANLCAFPSSTFSYPLYTPPPPGVNLLHLSGLIFP